MKTQGNGGKCRRDERRDCLNNAGGKIHTAKHTHERYMQVCFDFGILEMSSRGVNPIDVK